MKHVGIVPADNWFYVYETTHTNSFAGFIAKRIVVWAMFDDGSVCGLVALPGILHTHMPNSRLVEIPSVKGEYMHLDELNARHKDKYKIF